MLKPNTPIPCAKAALAHPVQSLCVISLPKDSALSLLLLCLLVNLANAPGNICFVPCACLLIMAPTPGRKAWFLSRGYALRGCSYHRHRHGHRRHCRARDGPRIRSSSAFLRCLPVGSRGKCEQILTATCFFRFATFFANFSSSSLCTPIVGMVLETCINEIHPTLFRRRNDEWC